jgi:hypothetical protein
MADGVSPVRRRTGRSRPARDADDFSRDRKASEDVGPITDVEGAAGERLG